MRLATVNRVIAREDVEIRYHLEPLEQEKVPHAGRGERVSDVLGYQSLVGSFVDHSLLGAPQTCHSREIGPGVPAIRSVLLWQSVK